MTLDENKWFCKYVQRLIPDPHNAIQEEKKYANHDTIHCTIPYYRHK